MRTLLGVLWLLCVQVLCRVYHKTSPALEDDYIGHFGNNATDLPWTRAKNALLRGDEQLLRNFSVRAHEMAKKGSIEVNGVLIRPRILAFRNASYKPRRVDVLSYSVRGITHPKYDENYWYMVEGDHGYVTEGKRPDCVYYLTLLNTYTMKFALSKHVCGIDVDLDAANAV